MILTGLHDDSLRLRRSEPVVGGSLGRNMQEETDGEDENEQRYHFNVIIFIIISKTPSCAPKEHSLFHGREFGA